MILKSETILTYWIRLLKITKIYKKGREFILLILQVKIRIVKESDWDYVQISRCQSLELVPHCEAFCWTSGRQFGDDLPLSSRWKRWPWPWFEPWATPWSVSRPLSRCRHCGRCTSRPCGSWSWGHPEHLENPQQPPFASTWTPACSRWCPFSSGFASRVPVPLPSTPPWTNQLKMRNC